MNDQIKKKKLLVCGLVIGCIVMVVFPEITANGTREAINLWLNSIVPTMLPFFFAVNFLKGAGVSSHISPGIYPFVMAILSGYPMGARIVGDYIHEGILDERGAYRVLSYSMVTGPAFLIGAVGVGFFSSQKIGVILCIAHYIGGGITSLFIDSGKSVKESSKLRKPLKSDYGTAKSGGYYSLFTDGIIDSFKSIGIILAYIVIFMIAAQLMQFTGIFQVFGKVLSQDTVVYIEALMKGALEMTVGSAEIAFSNSEIIGKTVAAQFIISFGGLSVFGQTMSMLRGCGISWKKVIRIKLLHGLTGSLLTLILSLLFI